MYDRFSAIVIYACILHYTFAIALIIEPSAIGVTAINAVVELCKSPVVASGLFLIAGSLAIVGLGVRDTKTGLFLLSPQQTVLLISAYGAVNAMISGQFADGVVRPHWFVIPDQIPAVAVAFCHTIAMIKMRNGSWK